MAQTKREARIPARMPQEVYERIAAASQTVGATLNQFLVQAALERVADCYPHLEIEGHRGGQPLFYYLVSVE